MDNPAGTMTDKNIVDRSRTHKNAALVKTVRDTRDRLQNGRETPTAFDHEMMMMHITSVLPGAAAVPALGMLSATVPYTHLTLPTTYPD